MHVTGAGDTDLEADSHGKQVGEECEQAPQRRGSEGLSLLTPLDGPRQLSVLGKRRPAGSPEGPGLRPSPQPLPHPPQGRQGAGTPEAAVAWCSTPGWPGTFCWLPWGGCQRLGSPSGPGTCCRLLPAPAPAPGPCHQATAAASCLPPRSSFPPSLPQAQASGSSPPRRSRACC